LIVIHKLHPIPLGFFIALLLVKAVHATEPGVDYLEPKAFTGTIYADADLKQVLFTFRRTATQSGSTIQVVRDFNLPNGKLAARERVVYQGEQLKSLQLEEVQAGAKGSATVESNGGDAKMDFEYTAGTTKKSGSEKFLSEILTSDMVGPYIAAHWDALTKGSVVKCRLVSISRAETVGFKFFKESYGTWRGKPVMMVTMQPSSIIIAQLVAPLHFIIEKDGIHRVLEYTGRTTPSIRRNGKWDDLDAFTVFDWK
jgi:hypothetical protein